MYIGHGAIETPAVVRKEAKSCHLRGHPAHFSLPVIGADAEVHEQSSGDSANYLTAPHVINGDLSPRNALDNRTHGSG